MANAFQLERISLIKEQIALHNLERVVEFGYGDTVYDGLKDITQPITIIENNSAKAATAVLRASDNIIVGDFYEEIKKGITNNTLYTIMIMHTQSMHDFVELVQKTISTDIDNSYALAIFKDATTQKHYVIKL